MQPTFIALCAPQADTPARTALEAGPRATDVYMGVDVFGRGTYGGGGATCDVGIRAAFDAGPLRAMTASMHMNNTGTECQALEQLVVGLIHGLAEHS